MNTRRVNGDTLAITNEDKVIISFSEKFVDNEMHIVVSGEIKNEVAHEFEDELMAALSVCNIIKLDLSKVTYIASIAMSALLSVQQIIDENDEASLVIINLSAEVREVFETAGFLDIFRIEEGVGI